MQTARAIRTFVAVLLLSALVVPLSAQADGARQTVEAFLAAWDRADSAAMWALLSRQSQEAYPQEVFTNRYTVANTAMGLEGVEFSIGDVRVQGLTAAVKYDVTIQSGLFGQIVDNGRTMRLVNDNGRWGVAWSSMDIFAELPSTGELTSDGDLAPRANIYDRNGRIVAGRGRVVTLYTARANMTDEEGCKALISRLTRRPYVAFDLLFAANFPETIFYLAELNAEDYDANRDALTSICGVSITLDRETRTYYGNNAMSHVAGYVGQITTDQQAQYLALGYSAGDLIGQGGVERMFERTLAGTPERTLRIVEPGGVILREFSSIGGSAPTPVQMTIDRELQLVVAQAMADAYDFAYPTWGSPQIAGDGAAVVLDVKTGEILAMVSFPLFDPLLFDPTSPEPARRVELLQQVSADTRQPFINHATQSRYTPGSVYKLITAAAVLNEGIVSPGEIFSCGLRWEGRPVGDDVDSRPDWRETDGFPPAGDITPAEAIMASCNPFFWQFGAELYNAQGNKLAEYARMLGLGEPYGIFTGAVEAAAELDNPSFTSEAISIAVGQRNVSVPPIQMAVAVAALANGGTVYKPSIVKQVGGFDGAPVMQTFEPEVLNTIEFKPGVLEEIQAGMCGATTNEDLGTAYIRFDNAPYRVCGKTGTAQTARYPNAWFVAYGPAEDPEIAVVIVVSQSLEGSQVSAPIARRIFDWYFNAPEYEPFPEWWAQGPYVPLNIPAGSTGG